MLLRENWGKDPSHAARQLIVLPKDQLSAIYSQMIFDVSSCDSCESWEDHGWKP